MSSTMQKASITYISHECDIDNSHVEPLHSTVHQDRFEVLSVHLYGVLTTPSFVSIRIPLKQSCNIPRIAVPHYRFIWSSLWKRSVFFKPHSFTDRLQKCGAQATHRFLIRGALINVFHNQLLSLLHARMLVIPSTRRFANRNTY